MELQFFARLIAVLLKAERKQQLKETCLADSTTKNKHGYEYVSKKQVTKSV
jgi:hypothetical protein